MVGALRGTAVAVRTSRLDHTSDSCRTAAASAANLDDEEVWRINAAVATHGSRRVDDLLREWGQLRAVFFSKAWLMGEIERESQFKKPSQIKADYKVTPSDQRMKIEEARESCRSKLREIERTVNAETTGEELTL